MADSNDKPAKHETNVSVEDNQSAVSRDVERSGKETTVEHEGDGIRGVAKAGQGETSDEKGTEAAQQTEGEKTIVSGSSTKDDTEGNEEQQEPEDESKYLSGYKLAILSLGLCLTTFLIALDNTILATAIPKITTVFNSLNDVGWYGSSYLLTTCSLQPSFGKVYTYFDVKYTYLFALLLFEVGSIICAAATSSPMFIVGRAVAGAGAAALFSGGMTIIGFSVPLRKRAIYIAALSSMFGIASVVGPVLGSGALTDKVSWRWCFWINLPFGAVSMVVVFFFFVNPERQYSHLTVKERIKKMDLLGAVFLICAIVSLLLALQWGGQTYPWRNSNLWKKDDATIPVRVFKQRTIWVSSVFSALLSMALYIHIFYLPFYFQAIKGTTAEESGIRTVAYLVSVTVSSIIIGGSITVLGYYTPFMYVGSALFTIGSGMLYTLQVDSGPAKWIGYQVLTGIGCGASVQIPFIAVQVVASEKDMPTANALVMFFNSLGGAISLSIAQNVLLNGLIREVPRYAPGLDPRVVTGAGATFLRRVIPEMFLEGVLVAYMKSLSDTFVVAIATGGIATLVSFGMEFKSVKGKKIVAGGGA
ncbi:MFS transporter [Periconia macrospinosa]|uniref:MFS transporter n=1 Tax=Periconia macrospinosa TaxID=97972 RepID=A0A2V1E9Z9_9PLEO|nr:MFS transporter [Periconia macrospinosa]